MNRRTCEDAFAECGLLEALAPLDPRVAGTPPLGLAFLGSDIDVLCFAPDPHRFIDAVWDAFSDAPAFTAKQWVDPPRPVVASFGVAGWRIELYGEAMPVERQRGWRHFAVERRDHEEQDLVKRKFTLSQVEFMIGDGTIKDATTVAAAGLLRLKGLI